MVNATEKLAPPPPKFAYRDAPDPLPPTTINVTVAPHCCKLVSST